MKQQFNNKVVDLLNLKDTKGDVGIEIEMELQKSNADPTKFQDSWRLEDDGSLKVNGVEFVLKKPVKFEDVPPLIDNLKYNLDASDMKIRPSIRAGIHIHVNMQQSTMKQVYSMICAYYPMESALTRFCGNGREGNLFCLRARDASGVVQTLETSLEQNDLMYLNTDNLRYAALNIRSLFNYGTLEFRALATTPELDLIVDWCRMLQKLKEYSHKLKNNWEPLHSISGDGPRKWMQDVFGPELFAKLDYPELEEDVIKDSRNIQYLVSLTEG